MKSIIRILVAIMLVIIPASAITQFNFTNTTGGNWNISVFNGTSGSMVWQVPAGVTSVEVVVVAGGGSGGGGNYLGGGGGAGGVNYTFLTVTAGQTANVFVGGGAAGAAPTAAGTNGTASYFNISTQNVTATGGGGGATIGIIPKAGGSGGGAAANAFQAGGTNVSGQGFPGGWFTTPGQTSGAAGGSCGGIGGNATATRGGNSSNGCYFPNFSTYAGSPLGWFASGGGGAGYAVGAVPNGTAGLGGGTDGSQGASAAATANTGGGSGGAERNGAATSGAGGSGIVMIKYGSPALVTPINSSFTQSPNPSTVGQAVTFTDTSTGSPVTWNWTLYGSSPTNTTQNAAYTYTVAGAYTIFLNVTNSTGSWSNSSQIHNVVNASGFAPQDIWMEGQYLQVFHITDSTTGLPIPVVQIQDTSMQTFSTTNGTGYLTEPFGSSTVTFVATGYTSRAISYVFDADASHDVQLAPSSTSQQNVWYTPWQVRIRIVDFYGAPLPGTNVTASYIAQTLPSTDTSWLVTAFGISSDVASDMVNSAKAMGGITDDNGGLSFTMFKSLEYHLVIANATSGVASTKNLYPSDQEYVIYVRTAGQTANNNTLATRNATLPWYSLNSTYISLNMTYQDPSSCTSAITFRVWFRDNGTEVHNATQPVGTLAVSDSHIIPKAPIGTEYLWGYNATTVC